MTQSMVGAVRATLVVMAVVLLLPLVVAAQPTRLLPFEKAGRWGYKTPDGKVAIEPHFSVARDFSPEGIAAVVDEEGWAYIDRSGRIVIRPYIFDNGPDYFAEGLARFTAGGKFGFFDQRGQVVIPPRFGFAKPFSEGLSAVCDGCREIAEGEHRRMQGGTWGYINRSGGQVIPLQFEEAESFNKGQARVKLKGYWKYIDRKGTVMPEAPIGVARMESDGTIVLQLRAEGPGGIVGDALMRYPVGHPQYREILQHLGGLEKGQSKPVPPWPEESTEASKRSADVDVELGNKQVLADTFRNLVRYALLKTRRDVVKLGVEPASFSVEAIDESLAAGANAGLFKEHRAPSLKALLAKAREPSLTFHFYWKAPPARQKLEAAFALSYEPDGNLKVLLLWLGLPERVPISPRVGVVGGFKPLEEAVEELLRVRDHGRLAPYPPPR